VEVFDGVYEQLVKEVHQAGNSEETHLLFTQAQETALAAFRESEQDSNHAASLLNQLQDRLDSLLSQFRDLSQLQEDTLTDVIVGAYSVEDIASTFQSRKGEAELLDRAILRLTTATIPAAEVAYKSAFAECQSRIVDVVKSSARITISDHLFPASGEASTDDGPLQALAGTIALVQMASDEATRRATRAGFCHGVMTSVLAKSGLEVNCGR
jgi:hypothetical protein